MGLLNNILSKVFGSKSDKDLKELTPFADKAKSAFEVLAPLSHDQLRNKTVEFKERIANHIKETEDEINGLEKQAADQPDMEVVQLEQIYSRVDELKKQRNKEIEEVLLEILPEAFAVVKETAKRFTENPTITITANPLDRNLAAKKDYVSIDGDKATYLNNWMAAGNRVTWNKIGRAHV